MNKQEFLTLNLNQYINKYGINFALIDCNSQDYNITPTKISNIFKSYEDLFEHLFNDCLHGMTQIEFNVVSVLFYIFDVTENEILYDIHYCIDPYDTEFKADLTNVAKLHYDWVESMGWHNSSTNLEKLALIASEIGEAVNECRGTEPTENLKYELADIMLRVIDLQMLLGYDIELNLKHKVYKNILRGNKNRLK